MAKDKLKQFIVSRFMLGQSPNSLDDSISLVNAGIIDSTGIMELVGFLEEEFQVRMDDTELVPENLDSINNIMTYLQNKGMAGGQPFA